MDNARCIKAQNSLNQLVCKSRALESELIIAQEVSVKTNKEVFDLEEQARQLSIEIEIALRAQREAVFKEQNLKKNLAMVTSKEIGLCIRFDIFKLVGSC